MKLKKLFLVVFLFTQVQLFSQVSVAPKHIGGSGEFENNEWQKFKNTTTIFVLSNVHDPAVYKEILNKVWTVTPFELVSFEDFERSNYFGSQYSIAELGGFKRIKQMKTGGNGTSLFTYVDFYLYDGGEIREELQGLSEKKFERKYRGVVSDAKINIARFYVYPKDDFIKTSLSKEMNEIVNSMYSDPIFFNYSPGMLQNYFQKINDNIEREKETSMYGFDYLPALKNLAQQTLYVPSYIGIRYNPWKLSDGEVDPEYIEKIFNKYEYAYQVISDEELNQKILNGEDFYYLRYARMNAERFLQVVNAKTGEIVFKLYVTGLSYKIKPKHLKEIRKSIERALKGKKP